SVRMRGRAATRSKNGPWRIFSLDALRCRLRQEATTLEGTVQMLIDPLSLDRVLIAAGLASLAIAVAFGPELRRALARLRNRRIADDVPSALGVEPQQS